MRNSSLLSSSAKFGIHIENLNIHDWLAGWWYTYLSEKYEFVSRDYHSQYMEKQKMFQTTNQLYIFGQSQL
jgi:hypothetical protein